MKATITMTVEINDENVTHEEFLAWLKLETGDGSNMTRTNPLTFAVLGDHVTNVVIEPHIITVKKED